MQALERLCGGMRFGEGALPRNYDYSWYLLLTMTDDPPTSPAVISKWRRFLRWIHDLKASDVMMIFLTLVIAATGVVGIILVIQSGHDTDRLVKAAQKSANAAASFANSAAQITAGISAAVEKLKIQANADQTLALAANAANASALNADRPWMAAYVSVSNFAAGENPTFTVTFMNTGKRPAFVTLTQAMDAVADEGAKPVYSRHDTTPSEEFVVPGQPVIASWRDDALNPIPNVLMKALSQGTIPFRIYAEIEYIDVRTHAKHWTHVCWRYNTEHGSKLQFADCSEYNDAR